MQWAIVGVLIFVAIAFFGGAWQARFERLTFNGGRCGNCGMAWRFFDICSGGDRGYKCDLCRRVLWVSYPGVD